jgi:hypothetical protein
MKRLQAFLAALLAVLLFASAAEAAGRLRFGRSVSVIPNAATFGNLTWSGYGAECDAGLAPGLTITGPDAGLNDWTQDANGCIVPTGTYGTAKTFAKAAGQVYQLIFGSTPVHITLAANRMDVTSLATDAAADYQLKNVLQRDYTVAGSVQLGTSISLRDGAVVRFESITAPTWDISTPVGGYEGAGTITNAGSGYTNGTHFNVPATGGSGTGMVLVVTAAGGVVTQIHVNSWGDGAYVNGDVIGLTVPSGTLLAGSGLQYTIANANGRIEIRSETADTTSTDAYGNLTRGGGAIIEGIEFAGTGNYLIPIDFRYINFEWTHASVKPFDFFMTYRSSAEHSRYGISFYNNFCGVTGPLTAAQIDEDCFAVRQGTAQDNYVHNIDRGMELGTDTGNNSLYSTAHRNVGGQIYVDFIDTRGPLNVVTENHGFDFSASAAAHGDAVQHFGIEDGLTYANVIRMEKNTFTRNAGVLNSVSPQGSAGFFGDTVDPARMEDVIVRNNIGWSPACNGAAITRSTDPEVKYNLVIRPLTGAPNTNGSWSPCSPNLRLINGSGGVVERNVNNGNVSLESQPGATTADNLTPAVSSAAYTAAWPNLDQTGATQGNRLEFLRQMTPANRLNTDSPPGVMKSDGTAIGPLFPACPGDDIGAWNDGTVWDCSNPTWRSAHPEASWVFLGGAAWRRRRRPANDDAPGDVRRAA